MRHVWVLVVAACGAAPPPAPRAPYPELVREAPGGWLDDDGTYHSEELPLAVWLPADAELAFDHLAHKSVLVGSFDGIGMLLQWWKMDGAPSRGTLDEYIEAIDTEHQLDGDAMADFAIEGATFARGKAWTDREAGTHTAMRIAWMDPWLVVASAWTPASSPRAPEVDRVLASLSLASAPRASRLR